MNAIHGMSVSITVRYSKHHLPRLISSGSCTILAPSLTDGHLKPSRNSLRASERLRRGRGLEGNCLWKEVRTLLSLMGRKTVTPNFTACSPAILSPSRIHDQRKRSKRLTTVVLEFCPDGRSPVKLQEARRVVNSRSLCVNGVGKKCLDRRQIAGSTSQTLAAAPNSSRWWTHC